MSYVERLYDFLRLLLYPPYTVMDRTRYIKCEIYLLSRTAVAREVCISINLFFSNNIGRSDIAKERRAVLSVKLEIDIYK